MNATLGAVMGGTALGTVIYMAIVVVWVELRSRAHRGRHRLVTRNLTPQEIQLMIDTMHTMGRATAPPAEVQPTTYPTLRKD
ncbi:hypothetical protein ACGF12_35905 [Kitasatospora sp. NPDC048296]|uniref:hypothetical protein n=1 Tax=Kitasatospora sp. NPDC048296 TaxID=3364048 RepID=UPI00371FA568